MAVPTRADTATTTMPTSNEIRAPKTTREKMSRPVESVPNQCAIDGPMYLVERFVAPTSYVAIHGANRATTTKTVTIETPMIARRFIFDYEILMLGSSHRYTTSVSVFARM